MEKSTEKEPKKLSLYLKPETLEEIIRIKDMLILTGKPSTQLPDIHQIIEGMITYEKFIISRSKENEEQLRSFTDGIIIPSEKPITINKIQGIKEEKQTPEEEYNQKVKTGRFMFNLSGTTELQLEYIKEKINKEMTMPTLIRTLTEFLLIKMSNKYNITTFIYMGSLFNLSPETTMKILLSTDNREEELKTIDEEEKKAIMKISWEEGIIDNFIKGMLEFKEELIERTRRINKMIKNELSTDEITLYQAEELANNWMFGIKYETYQTLKEKTQSRNKQFDYATAYAAISLIGAMIENNVKTITEAITQIPKLKYYMNTTFTDVLKILLLTSKMMITNTNL